MRKSYLALAGLAVGCLLLPALASAVPLAGKVGFGFQGGWSTYTRDGDQTPAADDIDIGELFADPRGNIDNGGQGGGSFFVGVTDWMLVGGEINWLFARRTDTIAGAGRYEMDLPALETGPFIKLVAPLGALHLSASLAGEYVRTYGRTQTPTVDRHFSGDSLGFKVMGGAEVFITNEVSIGADVGYRNVRVTELKDGDLIILNASGEKLKIDYSGLMLQGALRFYF